MKTLILNGSPKPNGDTAALVEQFVRHLDGEIKTLSHVNNVSPCIDCRYCWNNVGCAVHDEMQQVYSFIQQCDNVVLASPIWFSSLSGPLLNMCSRVQTYFAANYFRKAASDIKVKNGVLILVGAQPGTEIIPAQNALTIMRFFNVHRAGVMKIFSLDTNNTPAAVDGDALRQCRQAAETLNALHKKGKTND